MNNDFGIKLRLLREKSGLKQLEMAELLSVNINTLGGYERGDRLPDIDYLIKFAEIADVNLVELINSRILSSANYSDDKNTKVQKFLRHLNRDDMIYEMAFKAKAWKKAKSDALNSNYGDDSKYANVESNSLIQKYEIDRNLFKNCLQACMDYYKDAFKNLPINDSYSVIINSYNLMCKMSLAFNKDIVDLRKLEAQDVLKQFEVFGAMDKLPKLGG